MTLPKAVFATLSDESHNQLLAKVGPKYKKIYTHHVTLVYAPNKSEIDNLLKVVNEGDEVVIKVGRLFWANGVEAIEAKVFTLDGKEVPIKNAKPHITISTDNKPPVLSNDMLAQTGEFTGGFEGAQLIGGSYKGTIEFVYKF
jgi:hypothetical protein